MSAGETRRSEQFYKAEARAKRGNSPVLLCANYRDSLQTRISNAFLLPAKALALKRGLSLCARRIHNSMIRTLAALASLTSAVSFRCLFPGCNFLYKCQRSSYNAAVYS